MQRVQKLVIKISLLILTISYGCKAQTKKNDYVLLNKIINSTKENNVTYKLNELARSTNSETFERYYKYRFLKEKTYTKYEYDEANDTIKEIAEGERVKLEQDIYSRYSVLDNILTKDDFKKILKDSSKTKWNEIELIDNKELIEIKAYTNKSDLAISTGKYISKPYYSIDGKYALVLFSSAEFPKLFIFKKEGNDWIKFNVIKQFHN